MTNVVEMEVLTQRTVETENALGNVLTRLTSVLEEENRHLESGVAADHANYITSKNQVLRELMAMQRTIQFKTLPTETFQKLKLTRKLVDRNHHLLKLQVSALNEVTSFLTQSAISEQGDGTYTRERQ